jgi:hypothetical protein
MTKQPRPDALTVEQTAPGASATDSATGFAHSDPRAEPSDVSAAPATTSPETAEPLPLGRVHLTPSQESPPPRSAAAPAGDDAGRIPAAAAGREPRAKLRSALCALRRLWKQLCDVPPRLARALARARGAARRMRADAVAKRGSNASGRSRASRSGSRIIPVLLSLNTLLLAVMMALLLLL